MNPILGTSVEKSIFGIQTGVLGIWAYNETKLSNTIALRTELGFDFGIWETTFYDDYDSPFLLTPVIVIEPRFYYNLEKRSKNSKSLMLGFSLEIIVLLYHGQRHKERERSANQEHEGVRERKKERRVQ